MLLFTLRNFLLLFINMWSLQSITFYLQLHYVTESLLHLTMSYSYSYLACQQIPIRASYRACKKLFSWDASETSVLHKFWIHPAAILLNKCNKRLSSLLHSNSSLYHLLQRSMFSSTMSGRKNKQQPLTQHSFRLGVGCFRYNIFHVG